ncbi:hypothetical protein LshimejAT787_1901520 [Lyophyllum shimeji]|uniref:Uncharacterized protein n=1 Tax=Lyophyllum shimeji TaxID=47721 RepID=A0A9P3Q0Z6_LYOSH|nr:hypothetical protein LshimejAT787_1901520 [Lyophyllum shimeji]
MPAIRKPLRERCNVQLNVKTAIPPSDDIDSWEWSDLDYAAPNHFRTRKVIDVRVPYTKAASRKCAARAPVLYPIYTPTTEGLSSLHRLVPYIYVGFYDKHLPRSIIHHKYKPGHCDLQVDLARGLCVLGLTVPAPDVDEEKPNERQRKKTVLTEEQLLLARDFMALALPYYNEAHPRADIPPIAMTADSVRVLVTAPERPGAAVDIMSVVACYLTFASEESAETVVGYVRVEEDVPEVWKEAVPERREAVGLVAKVARLGV